MFTRSMCRCAWVSSSSHKYQQLPPLTVKSEQQAPGVPKDRGNERLVDCNLPALPYLEMDFLMAVVRATIGKWVKVTSLAECWMTAALLL